MFVYQSQYLRRIAPHHLPHDFPPPIHQEKRLRLGLRRRPVLLVEFWDAVDIYSEDCAAHVPVFGVYGERFHSGLELGAGTVPGGFDFIVGSSWVQGPYLEGLLIVEAESQCKN